MKFEKLENQLKERFRNKQVSPAAGSWEKLTSRLDEVQKVSRPTQMGKVYWIAASLLLLLGFRLFLLLNGKGLTDDLNIGPSQTNEANFPELPKSTMVNTVQSKENKEVQNLKSIPEHLPQNGNVASVLSPKMSQNKSKDSHELIAGTGPATTDQIHVINAVLDYKELEVSKKVEYVFSGLDSDVDSMLRKAQHGLRRQSHFPTANSIDPMALLQEVEDELDQSFREQLFQKLKVRMNQVRTSVATRND